MLEIINKNHIPCGEIKAAVFDFDGTFSTLRCGWEKVMRPLMIEMISGKEVKAAPQELCDEVDRYIDESTGIQTVYQMIWLRDRVEKEGRGSKERDEWWYKAEYNRRLMLEIKDRIDEIESGRAKKEKYLIGGCIEFITALKERGVELYLASGTDHRDVMREANALGAAEYFSLIKGAPEHMAACSKEAVIKMILEEKGLKGEELLLVGDGKVEIKIGVDAGAYTLGAATNEIDRLGVNPVKRTRLINAGADAITGDFTNVNELLEWMKLGVR